MEIDHEIFSTVILSLPLIQERQLSVSGERMCTILVNRIEDYACPVNVWSGKLTALDMTPLGWLGRKTSTQKKTFYMNSLGDSPEIWSLIFTKQQHKKKTNFRMSSAILNGDLTHFSLETPQKGKIFAWIQIRFCRMQCLIKVFTVCK